MSPHTRRRFLQGAGALGLAVTAGCLGQGSEDPENGSDGDAADDGQYDPEALNQDLPLTAPPEVVDLAEQGYESTLRTVGARHRIVTEEAAGGPVTIPEVWAWAADDGEPSVPGPMYRVPEGEEFSITYENTHERPHTVHMHALSKSWEDDGSPAATGIQIRPGGEQTYDYVADVPGLHFYHCHVQTHTHLDMGMYGLVFVEPEDYDPPDREYFLTLGEWDTDLHASEAGADVDWDVRDRSANAYTVNGRAAPSTFHPEKGTPLLVESGDRVRVHVANAGFESHQFHPHAHRFEVVATDGTPVPEAARSTRDVVTLGPAERVTIEFEADAEPGIYPAHCHKVNHVTTGGNYPGGMLTATVYEEVLDSEEAADVMRKAGAEL